VQDRPNDDRSSAIDSVAALRSRYREPGRLVLAKTIDHVDDGAAAWIGASPFFVLATTSASGTDASPRGGSPGFVAVLDRGTIAFGDLSGNNRLDSYTNLVEHPEVGLLFFVPGEIETLRVNGRATVTDDIAVRERCPIDGRVPRVAVAVAVTECFVHCGKAVRRGGLWDTSSWAGADERPHASALLNDHLGLGVDPEVIAADLEADYQRTLWEPA
jgi:PPOX class probable FMN-dependent enzyme